MFKTIQPAVNTLQPPVGFFNANVQRAWDEAAAGEDALHRNENLKADYMSGPWKKWWDNYNAARDRATPPPTPPKGFVAVMVETDYPDGAISDPWDLVQSGPPVCEIPPYQKLTGDPAVATPAIPVPTFEVGDAVNADNPARDNMPIGFKLQADGSTWIKKVRVLPFGSVYYWLKLAMVLVCVSLMASSAHAQINAACAPQPSAATASLGKVAIGEWGCWVSNDGPAPAILTPAKLYQAIIGAGKISPVTPAVAQQILSDSVGRLPQSKLVKVGQVGLALGGIAASLYTGNAQWSLIGGIVSQNAPRMISVIQNEIPSTAPFVGGQLSGPVTIIPGADVPPITVFAMRTKAGNLVPFTVKI